MRLVWRSFLDFSPVLYIFQENLPHFRCVFFTYSWVLCKFSQLNDLFTLFFWTDKLHRQHGTHRDTSYELRSVCFTAIQMAFETKRQKFISLALNGMHVSYKWKSIENINSHRVFLTIFPLCATIACYKRRPIFTWNWARRWLTMATRTTVTYNIIGSWAGHISVGRNSC